MLRGIVAFFALIIAIAIHSAITKGQNNPLEKWDLYGDFEKDAYIFKSCYIVEKLEELRVISSLTKESFYWISVRDEFYVACPEGIYMLIQFKKGEELDNCFCLEKMI